jgi:hypothetical protein
MFKALKAKYVYALSFLFLFVSLQSFADISEHYDTDVLNLQTIPEEYSDLQVKRIRAISRFLTHGALAGPGSAITGPVFGEALTHWWVEIETNRSDVWFIAHFTGPKRKKVGSKLQIRLIQTRSESACDWEGKREGHESESCSLTVKGAYSPDYLSMSEVFSWVQEKREKSDYAMLNYNCKDFVNDFFRRFSGEKIFGQLKEDLLVSTISTACKIEKIREDAAVATVSTVYKIEKMRQDAAISTAVFVDRNCVLQ